MYGHESPADLARDASEAIRQLNHATIDSTELRYPSDVYRVVGNLTELAHRLPQALGQIERALQSLFESGCVVIDDGWFAGDPRGAVGAASQGLREAAARADAIGRVLGHAQEAIAFASFRDVDAPPTPEHPSWRDDAVEHVIQGIEHN